ncbi:MAG: PP2C family protein-serine/threonine phosphatase [Dethiobacteria bacterium]|jgi:serine/threonine protein phosphatase PrpC
MRTRKAYISERGGREENEDYCSYRELEGYGCYILADGLGGHRGGALASRTAVESVLKAFSAHPGAAADLMGRYLEHAREAFRAAGSQQLSLKTTLVILLTGDRRALWGHIGDSRLYYLTAGRIAFQTKDHSLPQLMAGAGEISDEQIRFHEDRNRLTGAFDGGELNRFKVHDKPVTLKRGDAFLLCSDGFWEYVYEQEMTDDFTLCTGPRDWIDRMERRLLKRVPKRHDNYSALAVTVS